MDTKINHNDYLLKSDIKKFIIKFLISLVVTFFWVLFTVIIFINRHHPFVDGFISGIFFLVAVCANILLWFEK